MRLSDLGPGAIGTIVRLYGDGPLVQRLMELGAVAGTEVRVVRFAPLGDPMEIELHNYRLSIRRSEASAVEVAV
ncbi:MAG: ferrous iron transport protein A [Candidatus Latescibacterota bacterium]|nr:MAG: ferrous iron transport protein A [Candidatus Latescibacterota bacterium]